jgi:hypothetical protein
MLTKVAAIRFLSGDPHNCDFEILFATLVDGVARLARENGQYCRKVTCHSSQFTGPDHTLYVLSRLRFLSVSQLPCAVG